MPCVRGIRLQPIHSNSIIMKHLFTFLFLLTTISYHASAQETVVTIGTSNVYSQCPATPSAESYCQTVYEAAQIGMSGYVTKLTYKRYDAQAYTNAMHWVVYLGNTAATGFYSSNADQIPLANLTQVFDGNVEVTATEVIVNFDTPFYYNGTSKLAVAVNEVSLGKHYAALKATNYNNGTAYSPSKSFANISTGASVSAANPSACDQISALAYQPNTDITFSTCPWPSAITATNPTQTTVDIAWVNGSSESAWQIEAVPTGEAQGTGITQAATTNPYTFTGLDHSTVYDFYIRANCGSNEFSRWEGPVSAITSCGANLCFQENFDTYGNAQLPRCWTNIAPNSLTGGNPGAMVFIMGGAAAVFQTSLPEFQSLNGGILSFTGYSAFNQYNTIDYGTMSDPTNASTFTSLGTVTLSTATQTFNLDFSGYAGTDKYISFKYTSASPFTKIYLDKFTFDGNGACVFNKTFVDQDATGNNDGTSWANAYTTLQAALASGSTNDIWVAEGVYTPHASDRNASFVIPTGRKIYGGFAGTETAVAQRNIAANPTVLSGDLLGNDNATILHTEATRQDNSYHVIKLYGNIQNVVVDGFTISGGNANGGTAATCATAAASQYYHVRGGAIYANPYAANQTVSASFSNCILEKNTGTNVAVFSAFTPCGVTTMTTDVDFDHCIIRNNYSHEFTAMLFGGSSGYGIYAYGSLTNSLMYDNVSGTDASCLYLGASASNGGTTAGLSFDMINTTISNNTGASGYAIRMDRAANSRIKNSIIYGNGSSTPFVVVTSGSVVTNSIVEGGMQSGTNVNPQFEDAANDDYSLHCGSPAIEAGSVAGITPAATDLAGEPRQFQTIDMGAYEYQAAAYTASVTDNSVCLGESVTFSTSGATNVSWNNGVTSGVPFFPTGNTTFTVTGTDTEGCVSTRDIAVSILAAPTITVVSSGSEVCNGSSVTLTASGANSLSWNNGIQNGVSFVPSGNQTYTVSGIGGNGCAGSAQEAVTVVQIADVAVTAAQSTICPGTSTTISIASSSVGVNYSLRRNSNNAVEGAVQAGTGGVLTFSTGTLTSNRTFNVYAETTGSTVCNLQMSQLITITVADALAPIADAASLSTLTAQCEVSSLTAPTATDNCAGAITGTHNASLPISSSTTITWTYDDGNGNTTTQTQAVVINDNTDPVADAPSLSTLNSQCEITSLTAPTATDNCAGAITATHNASLPISSNTTITWTYDDGNGNSVTQTQNVVINDNTPPVAVVASLANVTAQCEVTTLTAPTATDNCAGAITGTHNASLPISSNTTITWTYDDGNGNTSTQTQEVVINDNTDPVPNAATLATITEYCQVTSVVDPTATDNCAGVIFGTTLLSLPITANTTLTWTYDDGNGNMVTQTQDIVISDIDVAVSQNGGTLSADQTGATYQWVDCDNSNAPIANETNQDFTPSASGNYAVEITINGCTETSDCLNMIVTGITEANAAELNIFPIPTTQLLNVVCSEDVQALHVYAVSGQLLATYAQNTKAIDVSGLSAGMYLLVVQTENGLVQRRFVKE